MASNTLTQRVEKPGPDRIDSSSDTYIGVYTLNRDYKAAGIDLNRVRSKKFWEFLINVFGSKMHNGEFSPSHPLRVFQEKNDIKGARQYLHQLGLKFTEDNFHLEPVNTSSVFPILDDTALSFASSDKKRFYSKTELLHLGSAKGRNSKGHYNNYLNLENQGIWGNPEAWNYVGSKIVSCGSGHMEDFVILYVDKERLFDQRKMFFDPEGLSSYLGEFGRTFMFKGGIPSEAITRIEVPFQTENYRDLTKIVAQYDSIKKFIEEFKNRSLKSA